MIFRISTKLCSLLLKKLWKLYSLLVFISNYKFNCYIFCTNSLWASCSESNFRCAYSIFLLWYEFSETIDITFELKFFFSFSYSSMILRWSDSNIYNRLFSSRVIWYSWWVSFEDFCRNYMVASMLILSFIQRFSLFLNSDTSFCNYREIYYNLLILLKSSIRSRTNYSTYYVCFLEERRNKINYYLSLYWVYLNYCVFIVD